MDYQKQETANKVNCKSRDYKQKIHEKRKNEKKERQLNNRHLENYKYLPFRSFFIPAIWHAQTWNTEVDGQFRRVLYLLEIQPNL